MHFHNSHTPGEMISRVDGDVNALSDFFSQFVMQIIGNGLLIGGVIWVLFGEDWRLGVWFLLIVLLAGHLLKQVFSPDGPAISRLDGRGIKVFGLY